MFKTRANINIVAYRFQMPFQAQKYLKFDSLINYRMLLKSFDRIKGIPQRFQFLFLMYDTQRF